MQDKQGEQKKSYVWLHPPKRLLLNPQDQLFVLSDCKQQKDVAAEIQKGKGDDNRISKKGEGKKAEHNVINDLVKLNQSLKDMLFSTKELEENVVKTDDMVRLNFKNKIYNCLQSC